jgi:ubiquinone/menaquinone biosynthesis C-methylase UbiE
MKKVALSCVTVLLIAAVIYGISDWPGFGFDATGAELPRLQQALALNAGTVIADVGAGRGQLTRALAELVGPGGHVFATEIDDDRRTALRTMIDEAGLGNVTVVAAQAGASGLPDGCCDAIVLRRVYHHLTDPAAVTASLWRALRPGGRLVVIDFPPPPFVGRGSFGVPGQIVVDEVAANGFDRLQLHQDWPGRGPLGSYGAIFQKPLRPR